MPTPAHRCLLIEGIPGTGKTTAAKTAARWLCDRGVAARWHLEEDHSHPVMPRPLLKRWREPGFGRLCTASFEAFAAAIPPADVEILEGTTFQSTARFLWAAERDGEIPAYLDGLVRALAPVSPAVLHLRPPDRAAYFADFVLPRRGPDWQAKLLAYVESTPRADSRGWRGRDGLVAFWVEYGAACDRWLEALPFPVTEAVPDAGDWRRVDGAVREWLAARTEPKESR